jgi:hypothetical protein
MQLNPYESPREGEPFEEHAMADSDAIRRLLTEIRDAQCELLQLQRDALLRQKSTATAEQFERAYPQARRFFELKRKYDPDELFQNAFYMKYGRASAK